MTPAAQHAARADAARPATRRPRAASGSSGTTAARAEVVGQRAERLRPQRHLRVSAQPRSRSKATSRRRTSRRSTRPRRAGPPRRAPLPGSSTTASSSTTSGSSMLLSLRQRVSPRRNVTCCPPTSTSPLTAHFEGRTLLGGEPFAIVRPLRARRGARIRAWIEGDPVGEDGALARALVRANLAQPVPPARAAPPVSVVIPVRDRSIARLLAALDADDVIVVDDASAARRRRAEAAGARYMRRARAGRRGRGPQRRPGGGAPRARRVHRQRLRAARRAGSTRCCPLRRPGAERGRAPDRRAGTNAKLFPRSVNKLARGASGGAYALRAALARYERDRSPLDRGPDPARVIPTGGCRSCPGRRSSSAATCASTRRCGAARTSSSCGGCRTCATSRRAQVAHDHRTDPRAWFSRRVYYGRTAAGIASATPARRAR